MRVECASVYLMRLMCAQVFHIVLFHLLSQQQLFSARVTSTQYTCALLIYRNHNSYNTDRGEKETNREKNSNKEKCKNTWISISDARASRRASLSNFST